MDKIIVRSTMNIRQSWTNNLIIAILVFIALSNVYCYRSVDRGSWSFGQSLYMNLSNIQQVDEIEYVENSAGYTVRPIRSNHDLTAVKVLLVNRTSSRVSLLVDENASYLSSVGSAQFKPLNPYTDRKEITTIPTSKSEFLPFLWGTVELQEGFQIQGWMFFETPKQTEFSNFTWTQADYIRDFFDR
ncbi:hypothetical protein FIM02_00650 [SAR202 cluster bacterium AD-802-E10_MRT_200m]|nr:hypothetical protein [SAR202 cluster bacterium AD-802-E10_MRT_200m]